MQQLIFICNIPKRKHNNINYQNKKGSLTVLNCFRINYGFAIHQYSIQLSESSKSFGFVSSQTNECLMDQHNFESNEPFVSSYVFTNALEIFNFINWTAILLSPQSLASEKLFKFQTQNI